MALHFLHFFSISNDVGAASLLPTHPPTMTPTTTGTDETNATQTHHPSSWTPPTIQQLVDAGEVVVRREFLVPPPEPTTKEPTTAKEHGATNGNFSKRIKSGNKRVDASTRLCNAFTRGECDYGEKCKFSHDVEAYLKTKPPDLPGTCTFVNAEGGCRFGPRCRYYSSHADAATVDAEGASRPRVVDASELTPPETVERETNQYDRGLQMKLRKKTYDFSRANAIAKILSKKPTDRNAELANAVDTAGGRADENATKRARMDEEGVTDIAAFSKVRPEEKRKIDFRDKLYLAPLTTVGNLPFRRVCKGLGADVTCGEMALATNLLQGQPGEWALLRRHKSEDLFGVQIAGGFPDIVARCCQLIDEYCEVDFIDINMGCPIDSVCDKGGGSMMLERPKRMEQVVRAANAAAAAPITFKTRMAFSEKNRVAHTIAPYVGGWGAAAMTLHGRTRAQRYRSVADWEYIKQTKEVCPIQLIGNGDVYSYHDYYEHIDTHGVDTCMLARGALIKPWLFTEIKERRDWDISSGERFDILKQFASFGLEHWGSDDVGVEQTRSYLLEWLSFTYRYTPIGIVEREHQRVQMTQRPPNLVGRDDLETLMASRDSNDWMKIASMILGPAPEGFKFNPKHKSNAYSEGGAAMLDMNIRG